MLLVRHAWAGERARWQGDDRLRPLDERGRRQAASLVELLDGFPLTRILSSPYVRCAESVAPLATARGLTVELRAELGEDRDVRAGPALLDAIAAEDTAVCVHGSLGKRLLDGRAPFPKGCAVVLDERLDPVRYLPPPA